MREGGARPDEAEIEARVRDAVRAVLGTEPTALEALPAGLGRRRFLRVHLAAGPAPTVVARVELPEDPARRPPGVPPEPALEPLRSFLARHGLPVFERHGAFRDVEILEDVGSHPLAVAAEGAPPAALRALYTEACDLVPRLQRLVASPGEIPAFGRRLDAAHFAYKADFFQRWSLPSALGREPRPAESRVVHDAFAWIANEAAAAPQRLAHRDFMGQNLHLRPGAPPGARLVMIDLQGAFLAPPEYDLVCLLRDTWVELPDAEVSFQCARIRPALPDAPPADTFSCRFDLLTLTRKGKDHALGWYHASRGDPRYLARNATAVRYLQAAAGRVASLEPRLARLAELVAALPLEPPDRERPCAR